MNRKRNLWLVAILALALAVGAGAALAQEAEPQAQPSAAASSTVYAVIQARPELESFRILIDAAGLADNLQQDGPFTVFAPTNEALLDLESMADEMGVTITDILLYHIVNGRYPAASLSGRNAVQTLGGSYLFFETAGATTPAASSSGASPAAAARGTVVLNGAAAIVQADLRASNGVVHIVDSLAPPADVDMLLESGRVVPRGTVAEVLGEIGVFGTFLSLAEQAGLMPLLEDRQNRYTVFAPTDEAFAAVDEVLMDEWLADPEGALWTILSYHIIGDRLMINQIANDHYLPTVEGRAIAVSIDEDVRVYLNGRAVSQANIVAGNDVIHVVDEVILP
jgi:transforming growth factor-beta-induced protein